MKLISFPLVPLAMFFANQIYIDYKIPLVLTYIYILTINIYIFGNYFLAYLIDTTFYDPIWRKEGRIDGWGGLNHSQVYSNLLSHVRLNLCIINFYLLVRVLSKSSWPKIKIYHDSREDVSRWMISY